MGTRTAGQRVLVLGLALGAVAAGSGAAAVPALRLRVHASLTPVTGTGAVGRFTGLLARSTGPPQRPAAQVAPPTGRQWRLTWKLSLPSIGKPMSASIRLGGESGATRVLCADCSATAQGTLTLTGSQVIRLAQGDGVVLVRAPSATLRGRVLTHSADVQPG
jgi:hypothetical protein